jgi:hypothetical protein
MAIQSTEVLPDNTLEEFRIEFNKLVTDVSGLSLGNTFDTQIIFEGDTDDTFETALSVTDPTADRSIIFPDQSGNVLLDSANINLVDNIELQFGTGSDLKIYHDGSHSYIEDAGTGSLLIRSNQIELKKQSSDEKMATFAEDGAITLYHNNIEILATTATGISVTGDVTATDDLNLTSDAAVLSFGENSEVTLTHVHNDGLLLNADNQLQFRDNAINIRSPADGVLDINADDEIELNSTLIDINGAVQMSSTVLISGDVTMTGKAINEAVHTETAHATTSDIWTGGNTCLLSGSAVTFTDVADAPQAGAVRFVVTNAAHVITDNAALEVDGNASYTCAAGDVLMFTAKTTSTFRVNIISHGDSTGAVGDALTSNPLSQFAATTSAQLAGVISNETGSGLLVFNSSPTLTTPALGTPSALVGTNITGTAASLTAGNVTTNANLTGHITSSGNAAVLGSFTSAQLATALTNETGSGVAVFATSPTLVTPVLGTPASGNLANCTFPTLNQSTSGNAATVTTNANLTGHITSSGNAAVLGSFTSAQLATALTNETGSGSAVFATSPTLTAPDLGTPAAGTLTNCTFPTLNQSTTGSAATLTTARTIGGVSFNGSANINLAGVNAAGNQNTSGTAAGLSATLAVASGGTGATTHTANSVLIGAGTGAVTSVAPSTSGNVLTSMDRLGLLLLVGEECLPDKHLRLTGLGVDRQDVQRLMLEFKVQVVMVSIRTDLVVAVGTLKNLLMFLLQLVLPLQLELAQHNYHLLEHIAQVMGELMVLMRLMGE